MLSTPAKRAKVPARRSPYRENIAGQHQGRHLAYRKTKAGEPGTWIAQLVFRGVRREITLAQADDTGCGSTALTFAQAIVKAHEWAEGQQALIREVDAAASAAPTVNTALAAYIEARKRRSLVHGCGCESSLRKHVLGTPLASIDLPKLTASALTRWRSSLPLAALGCDRGLKPATINRLMNDLKAALLSAVALHRQQVPASLAADIRVALKAEPDATEAREHQHLVPADVSRLIDAAFRQSEDFGRLVAVLAATGARFSQVVRLRVQDVQPGIVAGGGGHIIMPASAKGRSTRTRPPTAIPVTDELVRLLQPARSGKKGGETLLTWEPIGRGSKDGRQPWVAAPQMKHFWYRTLADAGLPSSLTPYALRHASIIRNLAAGVPEAGVAKLHDTSSMMIARHYAGNILLEADAAARRALIPLLPAAPTLLRAATRPP
jgi:integrase